MIQSISNWNNYPSVKATVVASGNTEDLADLLNSSKNIIARGNGRSYGDASLNDRVFSTLDLNRIIDFDITQATIEVQSGVLISQILDLIVPAGFFLPVVPGTKYITIGGAIAADIHGKNHSISGSFAKHVLSIRLYTESSPALDCSRSENSETFYSTCGGMGLTGIILSAKLQLCSIQSPLIKKTNIFGSNFQTVFEVLERYKDTHYMVAWLDAPSIRGDKISTITSLGMHLSKAELEESMVTNTSHHSSSLPARIHKYLPGFVLNKMTLQCFNFYYYYKNYFKKPIEIVHYQSYFFPLDEIQNSNKLYGKKGMLQYQFVIPVLTALTTIKKVFKEVRNSNQQIFLAVLKRMGPPDVNAVMSFPLEGYTLSMDFKITPQVFALLNKLDRLVVDAGGRIYLAKDARMSKDIFQKTYPRIIKHGFFRSNQSVRLQGLPD